MKKSIGMTTSLILSALVAVCDCNPAGPAGRVTDAELAAGRVNPAPDKALVITVSGAVEAGWEGAFRTITAGDFLAGGETVRTGEGASCELQLGTTAVIRVEERTAVHLDALALESKAPDVGLRLVAGTVLCRVEKPADDGRFRVRTKAAACGVRGTEFAVTAGPEGRTTLAVGKGEVAFWPAPDKLDELKAEAARIDPALAQAVEKIETDGLVVGAGRLAVLTGEQAGAALERTAAALVKLAGKTAVSPAEKAAFAEAVRADGGAMSQSAALQGVDDAHKRLLERIKGMWTVPIAGPGKEEDGAAMPGEAKKLVLITIAADTADTEIHLDGVFLGQGMCQSIFPEGRTLELRFSRPGYHEMLLSLMVKAEGNHSFGVELIPMDPTAQSDGITPADGFRDLLRPGETAVLWESFEGGNDWRTGYDIWGDAGGPQSATEVKAVPAFATHGKKSLEAKFAMMSDLTAATIGTEKVDLDWGAYRAILADVRNTSAETVWIAAVMHVGGPDWPWYQENAPELKPGQGAALRFDLDKFILANESEEVRARQPRVLADFSALKRFYFVFGVTDGPGRRGSIHIDNLRLVKGR